MLETVSSYPKLASLMKINSSRQKSMNPLKCIFPFIEMKRPGTGQLSYEVSHFLLNIFIQDLQAEHTKKSALFQPSSALASTLTWTAVCMRTGSGMFRIACLPANRLTACACQRKDMGAYG